MITATSSASAWGKWLLVAGSAFVGFLLVELVARALLPAPLAWRYPQIRYEEDPHSLVRLIPEQQSFSADKAVTINAKGFRGPVIPYERDLQNLRLLFLGDSLTFGYGVEFDDIVSTRVARLLNDKGVANEVINTAVPAYNTEQEVSYFEHEGVRYSPDWVVVGFCWNDLAEKFGVRVSSHGWLLSTGDNESEWGFFKRIWVSRFGFTVRNLVKQSRTLHAAIRGWRSLASDAPKHSRQVSDILNGKNTPETNAGWERIERSLIRLKLAADSAGIKTVVAAFPMSQPLQSPFPKSTYPRRLADIADRHEIPFIDMEPAFQRAYKGHTSLFHPYDAEHPNSAGHAVAAAEIAEFLMRNID